MNEHSLKEIVMEDITNITHILLHGEYSYYIWILLILPIGLILCYFIAKLIMMNINELIVKKSEFLKNYLMPASKPISLLITLFLFKAFQALFPFEKKMIHVLSYFNILFITIMVTWILLSIVRNFFELTRQKLVSQSKISAAAIFPILSKITSAIILILAVLFALKNLGFDIGAIIAALGIGGIGVALASQKNIENLFGGIILSVDQPIRVGDVGKFNNIIGTVIDVGLRSTKIQTADRTIIAIPNATLSTEIIETYAYRDKILISHNIKIAYGTMSTKIQSLIKKIHTVAIKHEKIDHDDCKINAISFAENGIVIQIFTYALTTNFTEYLQIQEDFILQINDLTLRETKGFAGSYHECCKCNPK